MVHSEFKLWCECLSIMSHIYLVLTEVLGGKRQKTTSNLWFSFAGLAHSRCPIHVWLDQLIDQTYSWIVLAHILMIFSLFPRASVLFVRISFSRLHFPFWSWACQSASALKKFQNEFTLQCVWFFFLKHIGRTGGGWWRMSCTSHSRMM